VINRLDSGSTGLALYMVLTLDVAFDYCYAYGFVFTLTTYVVYMVDYVKLVPQMSLAQKILLFGIAAFQFFIYMGFAFLARRFSTQSRKLQKTSAELHSRLITLEEMTLLKERNRIAGDIHNTVGHQLTTALVQVEAARMLMDKEPKEVMRRLDVIKDQVRTGLSELRRSVHAINAGDEYEDLDKSAKKLFEQVKNHAGVEVEYRLDDTGSVRLKVKRVLYNVMLEAITNAIRHGNCSMIKIHLEVNDGIVALTVFNNGTVPKDVKFGFGLGQMEKNLKKMGGRLNIKVNEDGWFGLLAHLPMQHPEGENDD
jgi:signal transduction histidine kinase